MCRKRTGSVLVIDDGRQLGGNRCGARTVSVLRSCLDTAVVRDDAIFRDDQYARSGVSRWSARSKSIRIKAKTPCLCLAGARSIKLGHDGRVGRTGLFRTGVEVMSSSSKVSLCASTPRN